MVQMKFASRLIRPAFFACEDGYQEDTFEEHYAYLLNYSPIREMGSR
jgi:hypothetical protein